MLPAASCQSVLHAAAIETYFSLLCAGPCNGSHPRQRKTRSPFNGLYGSGPPPLPASSVHSSHASLFLTHVRCQACFCLRAFARTVHAAWSPESFLFAFTDVPQCLAHSRGSVSIGELSSHSCSVHRHRQKAGWLQEDQPLSTPSSGLGVQSKGFFIR